MDIISLLAFLREMLSRPGSHEAIVDAGLRSGLSEYVTMTGSGIDYRSNVAAIAHCLHKGQCMLSASNTNTWTFDVYDQGRHVVGSVEDWTLPLLVAYSASNPANLALRLFLEKLLLIQCKEHREFALNAPCSTRFPTTALCTLGTGSDTKWQGITSSGHRSVTFARISKMCDYALSPSFRTNWYEAQLKLLFSSDNIFHEFVLPTIPTPVTAAMMWQQLHGPV